MSMDDTLTLHPDGTGLHVSRSALFGTQEAALVWRQPEPGRLGIVSLVDDETAGSITDDMWEPIRYGAAWQATDTATRVPVLKNRLREGFWTLTDPLYLIARHDSGKGGA